MDMSILEKPFDPSVLKTRKGNFGQVLSYAEGSEYVRRLNEAFAGEWSFEVLEHAIHENEVVVLGKLSAAGVVKTAFGGSSITVHSETGERISLADDLKAAATDSLKKACSMFGIGLHLYSDAAPTSKQPKASGNGGNGSNGGNGNGNGRARAAQTSPSPSHSSSPGSNGARLTQKQLSALWSLGRKLQMTADDIRERAVQLFKQQPEHLSRADASSLISEFSDELGGAPV
ncbi:MAG TPA: Rad52/Rad22 family DNA repair protein [Myxococcota bacterium]|nr:Rad52/Rad22 family DNA repair protein [Myxococcota bacterium]HRY92226.1 Rad52/Rad22 family DNA repair protein [Myxococcota bacterium]